MLKDVAGVSSLCNVSSSLFVFFVMLVHILLTFFLHFVHRPFYIQCPFYYIFTYVPNSAYRFTTGLGCMDSRARSRFNLRSIIVIYTLSFISFCFCSSCTRNLRWNIMILEIVFADDIYSSLSPLLSILRQGRQI